MKSKRMQLCCVGNTATGSKREQYQQHTAQSCWAIVFFNTLTWRRGRCLIWRKADGRFLASVLLARRYNR